MHELIDKTSCVECEFFKPSPQKNWIWPFHCDHVCSHDEDKEIQELDSIFKARPDWCPVAGPALIKEKCSE
jgi:hypothetical protein